MNLFAATVENLLFAACDARPDAADPCLKAIHAHLAAGGGRVRARICLNAGIVLGLSQADATRCAVACELLHNASLVQDDLLDRSTIRRGQPCVWVTHGDAVSVCAGDLMLSAAYGLLAEISYPLLLAPALRLVHSRTREIILGQALEGTPKAAGESTDAYYCRLAQGKSASLLSLSLELPLLLSGNINHLETARSVARHFAVAYQIADDLADLGQDLQEGTLNLALLLIQHEGMTRSEALSRAAEIARTALLSMDQQAALLPCGCGSALLHHAGQLRQLLDAPAMLPVSAAESRP